MNRPGHRRWQSGPTALLVSAMSTLPAGCSDETEPAMVVTAEQVAAAERRYQPVEREGALIEQLRAGDVDGDAITTFVERAYAEEIVFDDVSFGVRDEGREDVADMYGTFFSYFGDAEISWRPPFVGADTAVSVIDFSGVELGSEEFTTDAPLVEVDLLAVDDDRISSNVLFYEIGALERILGASLVPGDAEAYVEAWNSGRTDRVVALYAADAARLDGLDPGAAARPAGESVERFAAALDGASWTLDLAFGQAGGNRAGALLDVSAGDCDTTVAVVWTFDDAGSITDEVVHYDPSTVLGCPFVEPSA